MNIFSLQPYEIIKYWKEFRDGLKFKDKIKILEEINSFWWKAPFYRYVLDYEKPETWPSPWELIFENQYDDVARAYMMAETLLMIETDLFKDSVINILIVKNHSQKEITAVLLVDDQILNYFHDGLEESKRLLKTYDIMLRYEKTIEGKWKEKNNS